jgi:microcin C transport system permease protein
MSEPATVRYAPSPNPPPAPVPVPVERAGRRFLGIALSPLSQRRVARFKRNRRGYLSFLILLSLFGVSLFAELVANDQPLLIRYRGELYFPSLVAYPETTFGGAFETEPNYNDPILADWIQKGDGFTIWPLVRFDYKSMDLGLESAAPSAPSRRHWLGTDDTGRDVFARILYGFRLSLLFGLLLTACSTVIGVSAGAVQGYFGGRLDLLMQRVIEIFAGLPVVFLLIIFASMIEPGFWGLLAILLMFSWLSLVSVVRAEFLRARSLDYVRAARALGAGSLTIIARHVLPNAMVAALTFVPFVLAGSIATLTALDFLGLGLPLGSPSLGELLQQGKANLFAPWLGISAVVALGVLLTLIIFVSEAVRDAFDPRKQL